MELGKLYCNFGIKKTFNNFIFLVIVNETNDCLLKTQNYANFYKDVYDLIGAPCHKDKKKNFMFFL